MLSLRRLHNHRVSSHAVAGVGREEDDHSAGGDPDDRLKGGGIRPRKRDRVDRQRHKGKGDGLTEDTLLGIGGHRGDRLLRVILGAQKKFQKIGSMKVINVCEEVMEVFEMTGFADILTIE